MKGGETGAIVVPGNSEKSLIVRRLLGLDGDDRMPKDGDPLPAAQIALIRCVDRSRAPRGRTRGDAAAASRDAAPEEPSSTGPIAGPSRPALPDVRQADWVRTPIDRFVLARLEKEGLTPSPEAPLETLVRRVSLDLIGLPPSPQEVDDVARRRRARRPGRRLRAARRPAARLAALRRALGAAVARSRALRRFARLREGSAARDVEVPRLGDRRAQSRHAVRSVHHRADRRRHAAERHAGPAHRERVPSQRDDERGRRHRSGGGALRGARRSRQHDRHRLARHHARLRAVPQPQVRSLHARRTTTG